MTWHSARVLVAAALASGSSRAPARPVAAGLHEGPLLQRGTSADWPSGRHRGVDNDDANFIARASSLSQAILAGQLRVPSTTASSAAQPARLVPRADLRLAKAGRGRSRTAGRLYRYRRKLTAARVSPNRACPSASSWSPTRDGDTSSRASSDPRKGDFSWSAWGSASRGTKHQRYAVADSHRTSIASSTRGSTSPTKAWYGRYVIVAPPILMYLGLRRAPVTYGQDRGRQRAGRPRSCPRRAAYGQDGSLDMVRVPQVAASAEARCRGNAIGSLGEARASSPLRLRSSCGPVTTPCWHSRSQAGDRRPHRRAIAAIDMALSTARRTRRDGVPPGAGSLLRW